MPILEELTFQLLAHVGHSNINIPRSGSRAMQLIKLKFDTTLKLYPSRAVVLGTCILLQVPCHSLFNVHGPVSHGRWHVLHA